MNEHDLTEQLLLNPDLKKLINLCAAYIGNPLALQSLAHQAIVLSDDYAVDDLKDRVRRREKADEAAFQGDLTFIQEAIQSGEPVEKAWPYMRRGRIYCGCLYKNRPIAFLRVPEMERPLNELNHSHISFCAKIMASALVLNGFPVRQESHPWYDFLWHALDHSGDGQFQYSVIQPFMTEFSPYMILWSPSADVQSFRQKHIAKQWWELHIEGGTVVLIDGSDTKLLAHLTEQAQNHKEAMGTSDSFTDIRQVYNAFCQAKEAIHCAAVHGVCYGLLSYDRFKLYSLTKRTASHLSADQLAAYCPVIITQLQDFDKQKGTEYLSTLHAYLMENKNVAQTALHLNVHKNTVFYRINKLKEQFQLDLDDLLTTTTLYQYFILVQLI